MSSLPRSWHAWAAGERAHDPSFVRGSGVDPGGGLRDADTAAVADPLADRPADTRRRARPPHGEGRHTDDGRHRHPRRGGGRLLPRPRRHVRPFHPAGLARARRDRRRGRRRRRRRLDQGEQAALARAQQAVEDHGARLGRRPVLRRGRPLGRGPHHALVYPLRPSRSRARRGGLGDLGHGDHLRDGQLGEPDRRPRRARGRVRGLRVRVPRPGRIRAVPAPGHLRSAQRARPRPGCDVDGRRLCRLFVVERSAGPDHHG